MMLITATPKFQGMNPTNVTQVEPEEVAGVIAKLCGPDAKPEVCPDGCCTSYEGAGLWAGFWFTVTGTTTLDEWMDNNREAARLLRAGLALQNPGDADPWN